MTEDEYNRKLRTINSYNRAIETDQLAIADYTHSISFLVFEAITDRNRINPITRQVYHKIFHGPANLENDIKEYIAENYPNTKYRIEKTRDSEHFIERKAWLTVMSDDEIMLMMVKMAFS